MVQVALSSVAIDYRRVTSDNMSVASEVREEIF